MDAEGKDTERKRAHTQGGGLKLWGSVQQHCLCADLLEPERWTSLFRGLLL
jgi:hypothetical protein